MTEKNIFGHAIIKPLQLPPPPQYHCFLVHWSQIMFHTSSRWFTDNNTWSGGVMREGGGVWSGKVVRRWEGWWEGAKTIIIIMTSQEIALSITAEYVLYSLCASLLCIVSNIRNSQQIEVMFWTTFLYIHRVVSLTPHLLGLASWLRHSKITCLDNTPSLLRSTSRWMAAVDGQCDLGNTRVRTSGIVH